MPCDSSYMEPRAWEIDLSRVLLLLDELDGKGPPDPKSAAWMGMDRRVTDRRFVDHQKYLDEKVRELCDRLSSVRTPPLSELSLEMQVWWRDHQKADVQRLKREQKAAVDRAVARRAYARLSAEEREALGLKEPT